MITYEMSRKIANTSWAQLAFSGRVVLGICVFHQSLREVIMVQLVLMMILLVMVALPLLRREIARPEDIGNYTRLSVLRSLNEHEVIAEFLRSEFHHPEFEEYREEFDHLVNHPDLIATAKTPYAGPYCSFAEVRCGGNSPTTHNGSKSNLPEPTYLASAFFRARSGGAWRKAAST